MKHLYRVTAYGFHPRHLGYQVLDVEVEDCPNPGEAAKAKAREALKKKGRYAITAVERVGDVVEVVE